MTIDEAITQAREKAKEIRENIIDGDNLEPYESYCNTMVAKSAEEYEQLAEWLELLKWYEQGMEDIPSESGVLPKDVYHAGYNKAIDDFLEEIQWEYLDGCGIKQKEIEFLIAVSSQVAERLKAGRENE